MFWLILLCCGDATEESDSSEKLFREVERAKVQEDMAIAKKDLKCISVYLDDKIQAQRAKAGWNQPSMGEYEKEDCIPMYPVKLIE